MIKVKKWTKEAIPLSLRVKDMERSIERQQVAVFEHIDNEEKQRRENQQIYVKRILKNSSIYPLTKIIEAETPYQKLWWMAVLVIGILGSGYQITHFFLHYFNYPTVIDVKMHKEASIDFPGVTICSLNRMENKYLTCLEEDLPLEMCDLEPWDGDGGPITISERRSIASCSRQLSGIMNNEMHELNRFLNRYMSLSLEERRRSGMTFKNLIRSCSFNGIICNQKYFTAFQSLKYGNCFTFKHMKNSSIGVLKMPSMNHRNELELILNIGNLKSYMKLTPSFGFRIAVHHPNEDLNPEEDGINISPGFETLITAKQTHIKRLPHPYSDKCVYYNNESEVRGRSTKDCINICIQEQNLANCSCVDPTIPTLNDAKQCNVSNLTETCCLDRVLNSLSVKGLPCKCPLACFTTKYELKSSTAVLPKSFVCRECFVPSNVKSEFSAIVKVIYSDVQGILYEKNPMFENSQLFSNLGSLLSFWLGFSFFVTFDIVEMLMLLLQYCCKRKCQE